MDELEGQLQTLARLSPPTSDALDPDVLHERAAKVRRRSQLAIAVPAGLLVVVVLAAALGLRSRSSTEQTVPAGPPEQVTTGTSPSSLSARDLELLDWVGTTTALRDELVYEMLASATYASTDKSNAASLAEQRPKTDAAYAAFRAKSDQVRVTEETAAIRDGWKQFDNRWRAMATVRRSVDLIQAEAPRLVDDFMNTIDDLASLERGLIGVMDEPVLFRTLFSHMNLVAVTNGEARTAGLITVAAETGFYPAVLATGESPVAARDNQLAQGCGNDAAASGDACKIYKDIVTANNDLTRAEKSFDDYGTGVQKQLMRYANTDITYAELKRHAIEDGQGRNDLTGSQTGSTTIPADAFRAAARDRIANLSRAERQLLNLVRFPDGPGPSGADAFPPDVRPDQAPATTLTTVPPPSTTER